MRIIFMGTPDFAVPSLDRLVEHGYKPIAVVTGPDRPRGRGQEITPTPVKKSALRHGIEPILQPESVKDPSFAEQIEALNPDVIVVVAFRILPPAVFEAARLGAFNLHGSLLPRYRGAAPINHAIMQGETTTGVTTFFLRADVDTGNVILQKEMTIGPDETAGEVHDRMMEIGADAVVETVRRIESGDVEARPQNDAKATPAPKIHREDCRIVWDRPADAVHNQIRGLSPYPGAWTKHGKNLLKVYRSRLPEHSIRPEKRTPDDQTADAPDHSHRARAGEILEAGDRLLVACGGGAIEIDEIQQQGKRRLPASDFLRGYNLHEGDTLA